MAIDHEKKTFFYQYKTEVKVKNVDYKRIVSSNKEGMTMLGKQKVFEFFMAHPDSYRKLFSFIKLKQALADKYVPILDKDICAFTKIKKNNLLKIMFYLEKKIHFIKGLWNEYRIPEYLWNTDTLDIVKKEQLKKICGGYHRKCVKFLKNPKD